LANATKAFIAYFVFFEIMYKSFQSQTGSD
jgi:hypothetical protein